MSSPSARTASSRRSSFTATSLSPRSSTRMIRRSPNRRRHGSPTSPERERDLSWSPDSTTLLFSSAVDGNDDLYTAVPASEDTPWPEAFEFNLTQITDTPAEEYAASFSPDGERIAFIRGLGQLIVQPATGGDETVLLEHWSAPNYEWSPDGAWIAYSTPDEHYNSEIWVVPSAGGERYNVSRHPDDDFAPRWSPDGRRLVWTAKRADNTFDLWGVWLTREDDERTPAQWLKLWNDKGKDKKESKDDGEESNDEEKKPDLPTVSIDFDRLWERVHRITDLKGDEGASRRVLDGDMTAGSLLAFLLYLNWFFEPIIQLSNVYNLLQAALAALSKLFGILDREPAVREPDDPIPGRGPHRPGRISRRRVRLRPGGPRHHRHHAPRGARRTRRGGR